VVYADVSGATGACFEGRSLQLVPVNRLIQKIIYSALNDVRATQRAQGSA
jgi:hypothetical protein